MKANLVTEGYAIGPYLIIRKLGEGGMGAVYEALQEPIERRVAIKILHPEYARDLDIVKRFFNEARATNRIAHPSLVQISEFTQLADGTAYIVMEYLEGETLGRRLQRMHGKLPLAETLHIAWQVAGALAAAHDKGIIHRDLKPENVMLVPDPVMPQGERARLLDFGIAKLISDTQLNPAHTRSDLIMGTPTYMSPEQCRGAGAVDTRTDVYSLGIMLYQMSAGRPPFISAGSGELIGMHLFHEPQPLMEIAPQTPLALASLVHDLLRKERHRRPQMRQVVAALEEIQARHSGPAGRSIATEQSALVDLPPTLSTAFPLLGQYTEPPQQLGHRPRRTMSLARAALLASGITAVGIWALRQSSTGTPPLATSRAPEPLAPPIAPDSQAVAASASKPREPTELQSVSVTPESSPGPRRVTSELSNARLPNSPALPVPSDTGFRSDPPAQLARGTKPTPAPEQPGRPATTLPSTPGTKHRLVRSLDAPAKPRKFRVIY